MQKDELIKYLQANFPVHKLEEGQYSTVLYTDKGELYSVAKQLKEGNETQFDFLSCETAVDKSTHFEVVYYLTSSKFRHSLILKVILENREAPEIESIVSLWKAAELYECEIFDLFGIKFLNHPTLRRIFLGDDWKGFPLRKDYVQDDNDIIKAGINL